MTALFLIGAFQTPAHAAPPIPEIPLEQVFDALDATPAQRELLRGVAAEAVKDVLTDGARREALQLMETAAVALLSRDVDVEALEASRQGVVELIDRTSSTLLPRAVEAVEILTPAQRARARDLLWAEADRWLRSSGT